MGTWDVGIEDNDFVADLLEDFDELLKQHRDVAAASAEFRGEADEYDDEDLPDFWLAFALAQWTYGGLEADVLDQVRADLAAGRSLEAWESQGPDAVAERKKSVEAFIARIAVPRARAKRLPRTTVRKPVFPAGTCLSLHLDGGRFGAAFVVLNDESDPEDGRSLIARLTYSETSPPTPEIFEALRFRRRAKALGWFGRIGYSGYQKRLDVVGTTPVRPTDPTESSLYADWSLLLTEEVPQWL